MIKELHGKRYYMEFDSITDAMIVWLALRHNIVLYDEDFDIYKIDDRFAVVSKRKCNNGTTEEGFRGTKYHEWEQIKAITYAMKKKKEP